MNKTELSLKLLGLDRGHLFVPLCLQTDIPSERVDPRIPATFLKNLLSIGYIVHSTSLTSLYALKKTEAESFLATLWEALRHRLGGYGYQVMYPNFPKQVMTATNAELYTNALLHYVSAAFADVFDVPEFIWLPKFEVSPREKMDEKVKYVYLKPQDEATLYCMAKDMLNCPVSLTQTQRDLLIMLIERNLCPWDINPVFKETRALFAATAYKLQEWSVDQTKLFGTATDVLRFVVALQGGDVSLAQKHTFKKISRFDRKFILQCLNTVALHGEELSDDAVNDMYRNRGTWICLGEKLHPGEHKNRFPIAAQAFSALRSGIKPLSFAGEVDLYLRSENLPMVLRTLQKRPGEFARRLNQLFRKFGKLDKGFEVDIFKAFEKVIDQVPTRILLQVLQYTMNLTDDNLQPLKNRVFFPKGQETKVYYKANDLKPQENVGMGFFFVRQLVSSELERRFSEGPKLGKVWIDPELNNYAIPLSQRSASDSLVSLERGSRFPLDFAEEKNIIRFFIHWKQPEGERTDVDLSVAFYNQNLEHVASVSYQNLRENYCHHSGDITSAPNGASEYIDVDRSKLPSEIRYAVPAIHLFTGVGFKNLPVAQFGWMVRGAAQKGEIFEAQTVQNIFNLRSEASYVVPAIIDMEAGTVIWTDLDFTHYYHSLFYPNNLDKTITKLTAMLEHFINKRVVSFYDVLAHHAFGRAEAIVPNREMADTVFDLEITKDFPKFNSDYLK